MKKRILSLLLALCILLSVAPVSVRAEGLPGGEAGSNAMWSFDESTGTLQFSGTGALWNYEFDSEVPWIDYRDQVRSVVFEEGITAFGKYAFCDCVNLTDVTISSSVSSIALSAFSGCTSLNGVWVHEDNTAYSSDAKGVLFNKDKTSLLFAGDGVVGEYRIPDGVTDVESSAFYDCDNMVSITIPATVTDMGSRFLGCDKLSAIWVDEKNPNYSSDAVGVLFNKDKTYLLKAPGALQGSYSVPNTVISISEPTDNIYEEGYESCAFSDCLYLTDIYIPGGVEAIGVDAFDHAPNLKGIWVDGNNVYYSSDDRGVLFDKEKTLLMAAPDGLTGEYRIPETVTGVGFNEKIYYYQQSYKAFNGCNQVTDIYIHAGVKNIGKDAMQACSGAKGFWVDPANEKYSSSDVGALCRKDGTLLQVPAGYEGVYVVPDGCTKLGAWMGDDYGISPFYGCSGLVAVVIPDTIEEMDRDAFFGCESLSCVFYKGSQEQWESLPGMWNVSYFKGLDKARIHFNTTGDEILMIEKCTARDYYCKICEKVICTTPLAEPSHNFGNWIAGEKVGTQIRICTDCGWKETNPFADVPTNQYYLTPVLWAYNEGITTGTSSTRFSPDADCTRGQIVTFLWRAAGCPDPTSTHNPFVDVKETDFFYKAVLWAVEEGITNGTGAGKFSPERACNRAQVVTFMWRAMGTPMPNSVENPFGDVPEGNYYHDAVLWAVENEITNGVSAAKFAPEKTCTRGQIVTFLYRGFAG